MFILIKYKKPHPFWLDTFFKIFLYKPGRGGHTNTVSFEERKVNAMSRERKNNQKNSAQNQKNTPSSQSMKDCPSSQSQKGE